MEAGKRWRTTHCRPPGEREERVFKPEDFSISPGMRQNALTMERISLIFIVFRFYYFLDFFISGCFDAKALRQLL